MIFAKDIPIGGRFPWIVGQRVSRTLAIEVAISAVSHSAGGNYCKCIPGTLAVLRLLFVVLCCNAGTQSEVINGGIVWKSKMFCVQQ